MRFESITRFPDQANVTVREAIISFARSLNKEDTAIVYVAAHGIQLSGENYILAEDGRTLISLASMIASLRERAATVTLFLDACRNNPFIGATEARSLTIDRRLDGAPALRDMGLEQVDIAALRGAEAGLARMDLLGSNTLVVFATEPNAPAADAFAEGVNHGPFAAAMMRHIGSRQSLADITATITREVRDLTGQSQTPWQQGSLEQPIFLMGQPPRFSGRNRPQITP
jgi:uncharacterized caspase-like protein